MSGLPVVLDVTDLTCLVVGAGVAGRRKASSLIAAGATVTVIAPDARDMAGVSMVRRGWQQGDTEGFRLVVTATDDPVLNGVVAAEARAGGALVLRADRPGDGDLRFPAVHRSGAVTIAVDTDGASPTLAGVIRDEIATLDDGTWAALADWAAKHRPVTADGLAARRDELRR